MKFERAIPVLLLASLLPLPRAVAAAPADPSPADGWTPISSVPIEIERPGRYYLSRHVIAFGLQDAIVVRVAGVEIDLNGFTLRGANSQNGISVRKEAEGVRIANGTVIGFQTAGVSASNAVAGVLDHVQCFGGGVGADLGARFRVVDSSFSECGSTGLVARDGCVVERSSASRNARNGMDLGKGCAVAWCRFESNGQEGIQTFGDGRVERCVARGNQGSGIRAGGRDLVLDCLVVGNALDGIQLPGFARAEGNAVVSNGAGSTASAGIRSEFRFNRVARNCVVGNARRGILATLNSCVIEENLCGLSPALFDVTGVHFFAPVVTAASVATDVRPRANYGL